MLALRPAAKRLTASRRSRMLLTIAGRGGAVRCRDASAGSRSTWRATRADPCSCCRSPWSHWRSGAPPVSLAASVALALFVVQYEARDYDLTGWTLLSRALLFFLLGGLLGTYAERGRRTGGELRKAESGYRDLLGRLPAIVYTSEYGPDGRWLYVSPGIESTLGYSGDEWMADPGLWFARMHPEDRDQALAAEERSNATGEPLYSRIPADRPRWARGVVSRRGQRGPERGRAAGPAGRGDAGRHDAAARPGRAGARLRGAEEARGGRLAARRDAGGAGRGWRPLRLGRGGVLGRRRP